LTFLIEDTFRMETFMKWPAAGAIVLLALLILPPVTSRSTVARAGPAAGTCRAGLTLTLSPGVQGVTPPPPSPIAPDIPRGPFTVSIPLYPGATGLSKTVGRPVPEFPTSPYLQMAVAEYQSTASLSTVMAWYRPAFASCGWKKDGSFVTNSDVLAEGMFYTKGSPQTLEVDLSFGVTQFGGTYIAYAVEEITYPMRPTRSYLHGPFSRVTISVARSTLHQHNATYVQHVTVTAHAVISELVSAMNGLSDYHTQTISCFGRASALGPVWLTFIHPSGTAVHAFEAGVGDCGGVAVNGVRWLTDPGRVWDLIVQIVRQPPARS
jgi:hypothetical protein